MMYFIHRRQIFSGGVSDQNENLVGILSNLKIFSPAAGFSFENLVGRFYKFGRTKERGVKNILLLIYPPLDNVCRVNHTVLHGEIFSDVVYVIK